MLDLQSIDCAYGQVPVLTGFQLTVNTGEILCLLGRNGAGKTTALRAIMGQMTLTGGRIVFDGKDITRLAAHEVPRLGIGYVPQGRRLFSEMTVRENLEIGLMARPAEAASLDHVLSFFPVLRERFTQTSGTLSGGEQQMLAMARALCLNPKLLLLDEPTEGLMPSMIARIREVIMELKGHGVTTILVEQRVDAVLPVADRVAFVDGGRVQDLVPVEVLRADRSLIDRHVGMGR